MSESRDAAWAVFVQRYRDMHGHDPMADAAGRNVDPAAIEAAAVRGFNVDRPDDAWTWEQRSEATRDYWRRIARAVLGNTAMGDHQAHEHHWSPDNSCDDCGAQLEEVVASAAYARGRAEALEEAARMLEADAVDRRNQAKEYIVTEVIEECEAEADQLDALATRIRAMVAR